jgi:hypothetical protein
MLLPLLGGTLFAARRVGILVYDEAGKKFQKPARSQPDRSALQDGRAAANANASVRMSAAMTFHVLLGANTESRVWVFFIELTVAHAPIKAPSALLVAAARRAGTQRRQPVEPMEL